MNEKKKELFGLIFKTAADEFAAFGYAGARMDRIAEIARVNKATIYYHIGNKEILYNRTVEYLIDRARFALETLSLEKGSSRDAMPGKIVTGTTGPGDNPPGGATEGPNTDFQGYIEILGKTLFGDLKLPLIMMQEIVSGRECLSGEIIGKFMDLFGPVMSIIRKGQEEGRFREKPPLLVHFMAVAGIYFFTAGRDFLIHNSKVTESGLPEKLLHDREFLFREIGDLLLYGLVR